MRIFVANVGVNTGHAAQGARSPVFPDGSFEFVPIKETGHFAAAPGARRYRDLPCWTNRAANLAAFLPERLGDYTAHDDPDFQELTYGDILSPRAAALGGAAAGDELWFLARLWEYDGGQFVGPSAFYLVGTFHLTHNLMLCGTAVPPVGEAVRKRVERNAHWIRILAGDGGASRVLVGDPASSRRFERAVEVTPHVAGLLFGGTYSPEDDTYGRQEQQLFNRNGQPRRFALFGSITRTVQAFLDDSRAVDLPFIEDLRQRSRARGRPCRPRSAK